MIKFIQGLKSLIFTVLMLLVASLTACGGEGGSILDNLSDTDVKLQSLTVSNGTLCPVFNPDNENYTLELAPGVPSLDISPVTKNSKLKISLFVDDIVWIPKSSNRYTLPIIKKTTIVKINVVSPVDIKNKKTYTVQVNRIPEGEKSNNAGLAGLQVSTGTLSPAFAPGSTAYNLEVPNGTESIRVTPVVAGIGASVIVNDINVTSGNESGPIPATAWNQPVKIQVTAEDKTTVLVYSIAVTVAGDTSSNADLTEIKLSPGTIRPAFDANTLRYTVELPVGTTSMSVTTGLAGVNGKLEINNQVVDTSAGSISVDLNPGNNTITLLVTAEDGTTKTYVIEVTVLTTDMSTNSKLASLELSSGNLNPSFNANETIYTSIVNNSVDSIKVIPATASDKATVKVNGKLVLSGTQSQEIPLAVDKNTITIVVTAQDNTKNTYTITVIRESEVVSSNNDLQSMTLSQGSLTPAFTPGTLFYSAEVGSDITSLTVTPVTAVVSSIVKVNGNTVSSGSASQAVNLTAGSNNIIDIAVTAANGTTKNYTVNIIRPIPGANTNADLLSLTLSKGTLSPAFASNVTLYSATVAYVDSTISLTPIAADSKATVTISVNTVPAPGLIELAVGPNEIAVVVTAEDTSVTKTYIINVTRSAAGANADLQSLVISQGALTPQFSSSSTAYTVSVDNTITSVTVIPTLADSKASVRVNGTLVDSGLASAPITLSVGSGNTIAVIVTAEDTVTLKSYSITVTRQAPPASTNATLSSITVTKTYEKLEQVKHIGLLGIPYWLPEYVSYTIDIDFDFSPDTTDYTVKHFVLGEVNVKITVNGTPADSHATVSVDPAGQQSVILHESFNIDVTAQDGITKKTYKIDYWNSI